MWSKWVETRKDPNKPWDESSGVSPREGSTQSKSWTKCAKRCGWSSGYFEPHPRQRSLQRVRLANGRLGGTEIPFRSTWYHLRTSPGNERFGVCSRIIAVFVTRVKCLQHTWRKISTNTVPWWYWRATLNTCSVHWGGGFHSRHFRCQSKRS